MNPLVAIKMGQYTLMENEVEDKFQALRDNLTPELQKSYFRKIKILREQYVAAKEIKLILSLRLQLNLYEYALSLEDYHSWNTVCQPNEGDTISVVYMYGRLEDVSVEHMKHFGNYIVAQKNIFPSEANPVYWKYE